jgi:hypothetical protein
MSRSILKVAALAAACTLFAARDSQAQEFPGMNIGYMWNQNAAMDQQQMNWYWIRAQQLAREIPNNVSPDQLRALMNPSTAANVYGGGNANWRHNQILQSGALNRFSQHMRDEGVFINPVGGMHQQLPVGPGGYYVLPNGYIVPGHHANDYNNNLYLNQ